MNFTVLGAAGFIGGALVARLRGAGHHVLAPPRGNGPLPDTALGHVIYAAGVTADFRERPFDTVAAHTCRIVELLQRARFDSFLYLSSARIYRHARAGNEETEFRVRPDDPEDLYDLSKLTGEALCYASGRAQVRVARLSNVVGRDFASRNFLCELVRSAADTGQIVLHSSLDSSKDYILLDDVLDLLPRIALAGRHTCYNVAAGTNVTNRELIAPILAACGAALHVDADAPTIAAPRIDISRLEQEFGFAATPVLPQLPRLVEHYRKHVHADH